MGRPGTRVNTGLAGSLSGNARFTRAAGQGVLLVSSRGGYSDGDTSPRRANNTPVIFGMGLCGCFGEMVGMDDF